jgi:hypothetical protein
MLDPPIALAALADAGAPPAPAAAGGARAAALHLAPDAMHHCRLGAGDVVMVRARRGGRGGLGPAAVKRPGCRRERARLGAPARLPAAGSGAAS